MDYKIFKLYEDTMNRKRNCSGPQYKRGAKTPVPGRLRSHYHRPKQPRLLLKALEKGIAQLRFSAVVSKTVVFVILLLYPQHCIVCYC